MNKCDLIVDIFCNSRMKVTIATHKPSGNVIKFRGVCSFKELCEKFKNKYHNTTEQEPIVSYNDILREIKLIDADEID